MVNHGDVVFVVIVDVITDLPRPGSLLQEERPRPRRTKHYKSISKPPLIITITIIMVIIIMS